MHSRSAFFHYSFLLLFPLLISATPPPPPLLNRTPEVQSEIDALTAFRRALSDPLGALAGWDPSLPSAPCSWRGVLCSQTSPTRVVELRLPRLRLAGPISERLAGLSSLRKLSLRSNYFSGPLPFTPRGPPLGRGPARSHRPRRTLDGPVYKPIRCKANYYLGNGPRRGSGSLAP